MAVKRPTGTGGGVGGIGGGRAMELDGRVVVVTGATRGIGRSTARMMAEAGAKVVVVGRSTGARPHHALPGTLDEVEAELLDLGAEVLAIPSDLARPDAAEEVTAATLGAFGRADVLVSNAAFMWTAPLLESPPARFLTAYQVNVVAFVQLVQGLVPGMLQRGAGRVIAVSSGAAAWGGRANFSVYGASKAALERVSDAMHTEMSGRGVSFNTLRIDETVPTEIYQLSERAGVVADPVSEESMYTPEQVAGAIVWIARQPPAYSGRCLGFEELRRAGALPVH